VTKRKTEITATAKHVYTIQPLLYTYGCTVKRKNTLTFSHRHWTCCCCCSRVVIQVSKHVATNRRNVKITSTNKSRPQNYKILMKCLQILAVHS